MKVGFIQCIIISAIFAIAGFLLFSSLNMEVSPLTVSAALLISGIVTPWLASLIQSSSSSNDDASASVSADAVETLYVGNLPYRANENAVKEYFSSYAEVQSVRLMKDRKTGKRKGYGFIEVVAKDVNTVIEKTNDSTFQERTLKVRPAKEKVEHA